MSQDKKNTVTLESLNVEIKKITIMQLKIVASVNKLVRKMNKIEELSVGGKIEKPKDYPVKPMTPFFKFRAEKIKKWKDDPKNKDKKLNKKITTKIAEKWNAIEEKEKKVYKDDYKKEKDEYNKAVKVWEEKNKTTLKKYKHSKSAEIFEHSSIKKLMSKRKKSPNKTEGQKIKSKSDRLNNQRRCRRSRRCS